MISLESIPYHAVVDMLPLLSPMARLAFGNWIVGSPVPYGAGPYTLYYPDARRFVLEWNRLDGFELLKELCGGSLDVDRRGD